MLSEQLKKRYIAARRAVITGEFSHLNPVQREAVMATEGPLLLLAGAGSGKTTVLVNRVANILKYGRGSDSTELPDSAGEADIEVMEKEPGSNRARVLAALEPAEPWRVIAITFTNKAAGELKARLTRMLGPEAEDIWAMTFHSACARILRRDAEKLGYPGGFTIYDSDDSQRLMKRIIKERNLDDRVFPPKAVLSAISDAKDSMIGPDEFLSGASVSGDVRRRRVGELYVEYARRLKSSGAMDFDDLIYNTVRLLTQHADVRDYYQRKFKYVLVDEYQDTNRLQYILASTLSGGSDNICVVGDDDQSIYKFRGATIENILSFEKSYKRARVIRLEQNYRSTAHILEAANAVIKNNSARKGKTLWTDLGEGEKITLFLAQDENDEARYVADRILAAYGEGQAWRDNAVLYRINAQSNQLEYAMKRNGIPYRIIGGTRFFDRAEIKDMLAYLCVINNPSDDLRLTRIINTPARGIGERTVGLAADIAARENKALFDVLRNAGAYPELSKSVPRLRAFTDMILSLRESAQSTPLDELYDELIDKSGYLKALEEKNTDENLSRAENVSELKTNLLMYMRENDDAALAGFLEEISLYTDLDNYDREADSVTMMTIHSAKGLEFPSVFLVGAEEGIFPGLRSIGVPEEMEEERRLCYVAITRAKRRLYLCAAKRRMIFGRTTSGRVSRFVEEIPGEHIDRPQRPGYELRDKGFAEGAAMREKTEAPPRSVTRTAPPPAPRSGSKPFAPKTDSLPGFKAGDRVMHKAFGAGVIKTLKPMGGDALVEIEFEEGVKRLMLKAAGKHMTKI